MMLSVIIFLIVYFFIATEKIEKSISAGIGAFAVIAIGLISFEDAMESIDLNVIFLLIGMMTCVSIISETGFFEWIAIYTAKIAKGNGTMIFVSLIIVSMLFSAFLDNVTTVVLLVPVTILITQLLEISPVPFIICEVIASNIGGTSTLIGDPPNIIIGSRAHLSFNDFIAHLTPAILIIGIIFITTSLLFLHKQLKVKASVRTRIMGAIPHLAIRDYPKMYKSLAVFGLIFIGFFTHNFFDLEPGIIALGGMCVMLFLCRTESSNMLKAVEWDVILFFVGLFIIIGAMESNGVLEFLGKCLINTCGNNQFMTAMVILWGSAFLSAILDNIPFVIVMTPMIQNVILKEGGNPNAPSPLLWALALGACLGGNGTIIGASANVVATKIGERNSYPVSFIKFFKYGFPYMLQSVIIASLYIVFRYFWINI